MALNEQVTVKMEYSADEAKETVEQWVFLERLRKDLGMY
jgi:hypothetical protein